MKAILTAFTARFPSFFHSSTCLSSEKVPHFSHSSIETPHKIKKQTINGRKCSCHFFSPSVFCHGLRWVEDKFAAYFCLFVCCELLLVEEKQHCNTYLKLFSRGYLNGQTEGTLSQLSNCHRSSASSRKARKKK